MMELITKTLNDFVKYGIVARSIYGSVVSDNTSIDLDISPTPPDPVIAIKSTSNDVGEMDHCKFDRVKGHALYLAYHLPSDTLFVRIIEEE